MSVPRRSSIKKRSVKVTSEIGELKTPIVTNPVDTKGASGRVAVEGGWDHTSTRAPQTRMCAPPQRRGSPSSPPRGEVPQKVNDTGPHEAQCPNSTPVPSGPVDTSNQQQLSPETPPWYPGEHYYQPQGTPDRLDALIQDAARRFEQSSNWDQYIQQSRDPVGDFHPDVAHLEHPAAHLLSRLSKVGAPVCMASPPWEQERRDEALRRGPHKSAKEHIDFLREEFVDMILKGHWSLLPARLLSNELVLRLSPLGVVPQRDRRPRTICDYTFFGVNPETLPLAPQEAMQFGRALQRVLQKIQQSNPHFGPVYLSKIDIADGFYRIWIRPNDVPKLGMLFPVPQGEEPLIALPNVLPMGWRESPPYFSTATETVADLANLAIKANKNEPHHRLYEVSETAPPPDDSQTKVVPQREPRIGADSKQDRIESAPPAHNANGPTKPRKIPTRRNNMQRHYNRPVSYWDVYVDDFIGLAQGNKKRRQTIKEHLLHSLDKVLRGLSPEDTPHRQEPASVKKMKKGDATWTTRKIILGWVVDTVAQTIELPPHRVQRLHDILADIPRTQRRIATKKWHQVIGELRSMVIAIPGARGLFSTLQEAFRHTEEKGKRIRLHKHVHAFLDDFRWLARDLASRPTRIAEVIPSAPSTRGACDASGLGMGGVHFVPTSKGVLPLMWRAKFGKEIQRDLVSFENPEGVITNSDLELAGSVAHHEVLTQHVDVREHTLHNCYDNTPTMYWQRKGSTTTTGPAAYLLRLQALHQRHHRHFPLHDYMPGEVNKMADECSRLWQLTDSQILAHFNSNYPQALSWQLCPVPKPMLSALTSALYRKRSEPGLHLIEPERRISIGNDGTSFVATTTSTPSSEHSGTPSQFSNCSDSATETGALPPAKGPSDLEQWRTPYAVWARSSPVWGPKTSAKTRSAGSTSGSSDSSERTTK